MLLFNKQQQQARVSSSKTSENVVDTVDSVSIRNLIRSFVGGLLSLSYTVTLYPFVRLTKWWLSFIKLVIYDSPKLLTKKTSQYLMSYDWVQKLTLPWLKLIFVDLFRVADKDVSNYLRLDVEKLRVYNRKKEPSQLREKKNISLVTTSENLAQRITPVVKNVSEKVSSNLEKIPERLQQVSLPFVSKQTTPTSQVDEKAVSLNKEKMDSLEKQVNHLNLIISKQTSKIEKLKESQKNKIKADLEKYETLRKDKDELLHEKNRLEHTTLSQLQMMQEVQVMLNNQAKKIHEFESLKERLNDQVLNLQKENMHLKNDLNIEKEQVKKIHSEIDKWKNLKENVDHQLILVNRQLHTLGEENNQLRERKFVLEKNQKEHSQRLDAVEKIKQDFHDINIKLAQKDDELSELNDQMNKKVKENELLKNQLGDLDSELKRMSLDYSNLKKSQKQPTESKEEIVKEELPLVEKEQKEKPLVKKVEQKEKPLPKVKEEKLSKKAVLPAEEEKLDDQFEIIKEFESDRIKPEKPSQVESKKVEPKKQVATPKESLKTDQQEAESVKQVELKKDQEESELEKQEQKPLSRRKSQQQIPAAAIKGEPAELESEQVYQAKDNYVEELNFILDDIEKGEIENVQFHSIITNPKLEGSLVKLDPEQIDDLCDVLENSDNVSFVDFSDCGMDNSFTEKILSSLSKNNSIEVIDLANNKVNPDDLVDSVVKFITENKKCNKLLMKDWKFSNDKFSEIIHALQFRNNSIVDFKVDESDLNEEDRKMLHQALHNNISK